MGTPTWCAELRHHGNPPAHFCESERLPLTPGMLTDPMIPTLDKIVPGEQFVSGHFLESYIRHKGLLSSEMIQEIIDHPKINLSIEGYETGTIPASSNHESSYHRHTWTRDTALVACALSWTGHHDIAERVITNLGIAYATKEQRDRICSFLWSETPREKYQNGDGTPHIRFKINDSGDPVRYYQNSHGTIEDAEEWAHAQLDAIGLWLWTTFRFANSYSANDRPPIDLLKIEEQFGEINSDNKIESLYVVAIKFLEKIQFWDQYDVGPWEEGKSHQRASSIAMCLAALREAEIYFKSNGWDALTLHPIPVEDNPLIIPEENAIKLFKQSVENSIHMGEQALLKRIPDEDLAFATEIEDRPADAALILTLYPVNAGLTLKQKTSVLRTVYSLMGEAGFKRYQGDAYVGEDYIYSKNPYLMADPETPCYREAYWVFFDLYICAELSRRYVESQGADIDSLHYAQAHYKRACAFITSDSDSYVIEHSGEHIEIPAGTPVEAFFWDSKLGKWRPNSNSPLYWTMAGFAMASERIKVAMNVFEYLNHGSLKI